MASVVTIGLATLWWTRSYQGSTPTQIPQQTIPAIVKNIYKPAGVFASTFATYNEVPVNAKPSVRPYTVNPGVANVSNLPQFTFTPEAKQKLTKNAFVVIPGYTREFYPLYETNRYNNIPNFITVDSMLHHYHLVFDHILEQLEKTKLAPELNQLNKVMLEEAMHQYNELRGTAWENAAKRNVGFFAVANQLMDSRTAIPEIMKNEVQQELRMIEAHDGIHGSSVMSIGSTGDVTINTPQGAEPLEGLKEDYSQYIPRGHYNTSDELKAYFKAMMWYGRLSFRFKNKDEIKSAVLMTIALNKNDNRIGWNKIYEPINFFVGKSDDITYYQLSHVLENTYGNSVNLQTIATDNHAFESVVAATKDLAPPQINSMPIFNTEMQPDREKEIKGFRFMGQRFTIDASIFQRLVDRETPGRMLPKALDIPAALGSNEALTILTQQGETKYPGYTSNMSKLNTYLTELPTTTWTQNLYWGWLYALRPLVDIPANGYPSFMQTAAWTRKNLNTFIGSWSELKHDTILYAKQVYAEMGGGGEDIKKWDDRGYVEPVPVVYARLASLLQMTSEGLASRDLLNISTKESLNTMKQLALSLKTITEKELANQKLTSEEYELIRSYGGQLEHFWLSVNQEELAKQQLDQRNFLDQNPAAIVADVATDPNGQVLEEATGYIADIYVVVPIEGKLTIAKGGVYTSYEFAHPLSDRLTDQKWREMLDTSQAPALPSWTNDFIAK